jgi:hypothetical protein
MVGVIDMTQDDDGCELIDLTLGDNDEELKPFNVIHRRDSSSPELISIVYKTQSSVVADQNVVNSTPSKMYKKEESAEVPTYGRLLNTRESPKRRREDEARTNQSVMVTPVSSKKQRRGDGSSHNVTEPMPNSMWWPETPNRSGLSNATVTPCPTPSSPTKRQSVQENPCVVTESMPSSSIPPQDAPGRRSLANVMAKPTPVRNAGSAYEFLERIASKMCTPDSAAGRAVAKQISSTIRPPAQSEIRARLVYEKMEAVLRKQSPDSAVGSSIAKETSRPTATKTPAQSSGKRTAEKTSSNSGSMVMLR